MGGSFDEGGVVIGDLHSQISSSGWTRRSMTKTGWDGYTGGD
jgi:hypothetical protein